MIIKGNTVGTTMPRTDWNQTDPRKADYLKGKDDLANLIKEAKTTASEAQGDIDSHIASKNNPHGTTAEQVGARPNTWLPTIAEIGAAPSGYGLGSGTYTQDFNTCLANGWYYGNASTANGADGFTTNCSCFVIARNASQVVQYMFYPWSGLVLQRWTQDGGTTWHEEWVNPPLEKGVEYRTTERIQGKAVYKRTSDWGRIEYRLDGETIWHSYISNGIFVTADITAAGWYKIGTVNTRGILSAAITRLNIGGNFNSSSPYSAVVEISSGYGWSKAVTTLATGGGNSGMSKIATVNSNSKVDIYGYYTNNNRNTVSIVVDASTEAGFVSANLEAAPSFNESSANSVASTLKAGYVSREILWENSSPTSIFAGQTVTLKDSWEKYDSIGFQCNKGYGEMLAQAGQMCYVAWYFANDNGSVVVTHRFAEVVSGGIKISDVQTLTTGSYSTQNDRITPLRIYGIKGVN